jgi:hypothetical protein
MLFKVFFIVVAGTTANHQEGKNSDYRKSHIHGIWGKNRKMVN